MDRHQHAVFAACLLLRDGYPRSASQMLSNLLRNNPNDVVWRLRNHTKVQRLMMLCTRCRPKPQQEVQLLRALARILDNKITESLITLNTLQHHPIAGPAACALIVHAHTIAPHAVPNALDAQDTLDTLGQQDMLPAAALRLAQVYWLTSALESSRALLERPASAGDATAARMLAWVALTHAQQVATDKSAGDTATFVLLGFDDDGFGDGDDEDSLGGRDQHPALHLAAEARTMFERCLATQPPNSVVLLGMALAQGLCGQHDAAAATAQQLLQHCPTPRWGPAVEAAVVLAMGRGDLRTVGLLLEDVIEGQEAYGGGGDEQEQGGYLGEVWSIGLLMHTGVFVVWMRGGGCFSHAGCAYDVRMPMWRHNCVCVYKSKRMQAVCVNMHVCSA